MSEHRRNEVSSHASGSSSTSGGFQVKLHPIQEASDYEESKNPPQSLMPLSVDARLKPVSIDSLLDNVEMKSVSLLDHLVENRSDDPSKNGLSARGVDTKPVSFAGINKSFGLSMKDVRQAKKCSPSKM